MSGTSDIQVTWVFHEDRLEYWASYGSYKLTVFQILSEGGNKWGWRVHGGRKLIVFYGSSPERTAKDRCERALVLALGIGKLMSEVRTLPATMEVL